MLCNNSSDLLCRVFLSARGEAAERKRWEQQQQRRMESIMADLQIKWASEDAKQAEYARKNVAKDPVIVSALSDGHSIHEALLAIGQDSDNLQAVELSPMQQRALDSYRALVQEQRRVEARNVKELRQSSDWKITNMCRLTLLVSGGSNEMSSRCDLTLWRPSEEMLEALEEGKSYTATYLTCRSSSYGDDTGKITLNSTKQTQITPRSSVRDEMPFEPRTSSTVTDMDLLPLHSFFDCVGKIVQVGYGNSPPAKKTSPKRITSHTGTVDHLLLCDDVGRLFRVVFNGGSDRLALGPQLMKKDLRLAICNLTKHRRRAAGDAVTTVVASECTTFSTSPKPLYLRNALETLRLSSAELQHHVAPIADSCDQGSHATVPSTPQARSMQQPIKFATPHCIPMSKHVGKTYSNPLKTVHKVFLEPAVAGQQMLGSTHGVPTFVLDLIPSRTSGSPKGSNSIHKVSSEEHVVPEQSATTGKNKELQKDAYECPICGLHIAVVSEELIAAHVEECLSTSERQSSLRRKSKRKSTDSALAPSPVSKKLLKSTTTTSRKSKNQASKLPSTSPTPVFARNSCDRETPCTLHVHIQVLEGIDTDKQMRLCALSTWYIRAVVTTGHENRLAACNFTVLDAIFEQLVDNFNVSWLDTLLQSGKCPQVSYEDTHECVGLGYRKEVLSAFADATPGDSIRRILSRSVIIESCEFPDMTRELMQSYPKQPSSCKHCENLVNGSFPVIPFTMDEYTAILQCVSSTLTFCPLLVDLRPATGEIAALAPWEVVSARCADRETGNNRH